ncbi:hypothetical protein MGG_15010 [Pyricularia oryzae 70-15]|uniref:Uncharacterized protein n=3 Tax=Pyricularia oryzae TaxID=318829 RepID=G4NJ27_PYRO7|nr:uncharacterized protein MGG_15010 [Pyricularia oryzae 70-15]EHA46243.1 hypothetical protein MGG_15010 [Pyricularia oryzae 70-15]ELQ36154.1 hypothetical protein OOU_Y34scaffold00666g15 [Pyricularia oryzae Y34]
MDHKTLLVGHLQYHERVIDEQAVPKYAHYLPELRAFHFDTTEFGSTQPSPKHPTRHATMQPGDGTLLVPSRTVKTGATNGESALYRLSGAHHERYDWDSSPREQLGKTR